MSCDRKAFNAPVIDWQMSPDNAIEWTLIIETATPDLEIVSIDPTTTMSEGSNICIINDSLENVVLKHNDTRGDPRWRMITASALDFTLLAGQLIWGKLMEQSTNHPNGWRFETL